MAKITGKEGLVFVGKALVFDKEWELDDALKKHEIKYDENLVLIVRYEGPKGGPGMPEQLNASASIVSRVSISGLLVNPIFRNFNSIQSKPD